MSQNIELNYYPITIAVGEGTPSAENPQANTPAVAVENSNIAVAAGGSILKDGFLQSPNYVKGIAGWKIDAAGNAEFQIITAAGYIQVFKQAAIPTSLHINDIWIDTDDGNKYYVAASVGATTIAAGQWVLTNQGVAIADVTGAGDLAALDTADFATQVSGAEKPANNATVGATAGTNLKDSGAVVLSDTEVKNIVNINYGETIAGATLPVPVYVLNSDGEVYKCDANATGKLKFFGFALSNVGDGESGKVQVIGIVPGFSGLTVGAIYYVSDTVGTISTTPGTLGMLVGKAVSATQIKIIDIPNGVQVAGDNLLISADTSRRGDGQTYIKYKEIECTEAGTYRVKFNLATNSAGNYAYGKIYKNGVAYGTEQSNNSTTPVTMSKDLVFAEGDLIQLYGKHADTNHACVLTNFRIYAGGKNSLLVITN